MADKHKPVVVQSREKVERNRSALDRWIDSAAWLDRPADVVQPAILKFYEALGGPGQGVGGQAVSTVKKSVART